MSKFSETDLVNVDRVIQPLSEEIEDGLQKHWADNSG